MNPKIAPAAAGIAAAQAETADPYPVRITLHLTEAQVTDLCERAAADGQQLADFLRIRLFGHDRARPGVIEARAAFDAVDAEANAAGWPAIENDDVKERWIAAWDALKAVRFGVTR